MLKVGDIAFKKNEVTKMTVEKVDNKKISCVWFEEASLKRDCFDLDDLYVITK